MKLHLNEREKHITLLTSQLCGQTQRLLVKPEDKNMTWKSQVPILILKVSHYVALVQVTKLSASAIAL